MKVFSTAVIAALTLGSGPVPQAAPPQPTAPQAGSFKIAYVDIAQVFESAPMKQAAESTFRIKGAELQKGVQKIADSLQKEIARFNNDEGKLPPLDKNKREKALQDLQLEYQNKNNAFQTQIGKLEDELMAPIKEAVKAVLDDIRTAGGYALILANDPAHPVVAAGDKNLDVTEQAVLKIKARPNTTIKRNGGT
jgi:Skp family chaperone for outer membrane proteins